MLTPLANEFNYQSPLCAAYSGGRFGTHTSIRFNNHILWATNSPRIYNLVSRHYMQTWFYRQITITKLKTDANTTK